MKNFIKSVICAQLLCGALASIHAADMDEFLKQARERKKLSAAALKSPPVAAPASTSSDLKDSGPTSVPVISKSKPGFSFVTGAGAGTSSTSAIDPEEIADDAGSITTKHRYLKIEGFTDYLGKSQAKVAANVEDLAVGHESIAISGFEAYDAKVKSEKEALETEIADMKIESESNLKKIGAFEEKIAEVTFEIDGAKVILETIASIASTKDLLAEMARENNSKLSALLPSAKDVDVSGKTYNANTVGLDDLKIYLAFTKSQAPFIESLGLEGQDRVNLLTNIKAESVLENVITSVEAGSSS